MPNNGRRSVSSVWESFRRLSNDSQIVQCMLCDRKMSIAHGSSNLLKHLRNQHGANKQKSYSTYVKKERRSANAANEDDEDDDDGTEDPEVATAIKRLQMSVAAHQTADDDIDNDSFAAVDDGDADYNPKDNVEGTVKRKQANRSRVWDYFDRLNADQARCLRCLKVFSFKSGCTSNLRKHFDSMHGNVAGMRLNRTVKTENSTPKDRIHSEVWRFFDKISNEEAAQCTLCPGRLTYRGGSTSSLRKHLASKHSSRLEPSSTIKTHDEEAEEDGAAITVAQEFNIETMDTIPDGHEEIIETVDMKDVAATNDAGLPTDERDDIMADNDAPFTLAARRERSVVWMYFDRPAGTNLAICRLCSCKMTFTKGRSTSNFRKHLKSRHKEIAMNLAKTPQYSKDDIDPNDTSFGDDGDFDDYNDEDQHVKQSNNTKKKLHFDEALSNMKPTSTVDSAAAKHNDLMLAATRGRHQLDAALLHWLNDDLSDVSSMNDYQSPLQSASQRDHFQGKYDDVVDRVRLILQESDFVALTAAMRTIHNEKYMAVTAQIISRKDWQLHSFLLNCGRLEPITTVETTTPTSPLEDETVEETPMATTTTTTYSIIEFLQRTCDFWHITGKVFVLVAGIGDDDDAIPRGDNRDDPFGVASLGWSQMQCLDQRLSECVRVGMELNDFVCMRLKIHSIIDVFESDGDAIDKFHFFQRQRDANAPPSYLITDETAPGSWRKTLEMLSKLSVLQEPLDAALEILHHETRLSTGEWMAIRDVSRLLRSFVLSFDELCSSTDVSTSKAIVMAHGLQGQLATHRCSAYRTELSKDLADQVQRSIRSHMADMECDLLLAVCTFLDPRFKRCGFVLPKAFEICKTHMETLASRVHLDLDDLKPKSSPKPANSDPESVWYWLDKQVAEQHSMPAADSVLARREMQFFVDLPSVDRQTNPLQWWRDTGRVSCPRLAQVARKYLTMPATCAASRRALTGVQRFMDINWKTARKATFLKENLNYFD